LIGGIVEDQLVGTVKPHMKHTQHEVNSTDHVLKLQITMPAEIMKSMVDQLASVLVDQLKATFPVSVKQPQQERKLAYSLKETARLLGISYNSVYRLMQRGLLKSSSALRTKLISEKEILRFLSDTSV
jgi:DNA-directed RNA polymerase specialized sigma24 family protein